MAPSRFATCARRSYKSHRLPTWSFQNMACSQHPKRSWYTHMHSSCISLPAYSIGLTIKHPLIDMQAHPRSPDLPKPWLFPFDVNDLLQIFSLICQPRKAPSCLFQNPYNQSRSSLQYLKFYTTTLPAAYVSKRKLYPTMDKYQ